MGINIDDVVKPAKGKTQDGTRGFVFAAELSEEDEAKLKEVRAHAREHGKTLSNVALAHAMVDAFYEAYFEAQEEPAIE